MYKLTERQKEIVGLLRLGYGQTDIAKHLNITRQAVNIHLAAIIQKIVARPAVSPKFSHPLADNPPQQQDHLLRINEASEMLNVHPNTLRRWTENGTIPTYRIGTRKDRRFKESDIKNLIKVKGVT